MTSSPKKCLYCQTENEGATENCEHCGMPLPSKHPQDKQKKISFFIKAFWAIVIFCIVMMYYLPR
ncbi:MAG: DnrP protein [Colwellia sp.]|nr:DnrP protein [Colwellia sp.]MCW9083131.1 DnrP protein [Colwellia sp.]